MAQQKPLISIIVPVYNGAEHIGETLASIRDQTYPNLEVIVVDDGSKDETVKVVEAFDYPKTLIQQSNKGVCVARNVGVTVAKGDFIMFLDHDDPLGPSLLETLVTFLIENPDYGVASANAQMFFERNGKKEIVGVTDYKGDAFANLAVCCIQTPGEVLFRRSVVVDLGGYDPLFEGKGEDWLYFLHAAHKYKWKMLPTADFYYRMHDASASMKYERVHSLARKIPDLFHASYPSAPYPWKVRHRARFLVDLDCARKMGRCIRASKEERGAQIMRGLGYIARNPSLLGSIVALAIGKVKKTIADRKKGSPASGANSLGDGSRQLGEP